MLAATFLMVGAFDVLVVVLAVGTLDIGESGAGYLAAAHGAGAVLGLEISVVAAFIVAAVTGVSRSLLEVSGQTLLQRVTSTQLLARVFAFKEGLAMGAWGLGSVLVPIVMAVVEIRGALLFTTATPREVAATPESC